MQTLPSQDISTDTIYLVPNTQQAQDNVYDEYLYINNDWEIIGSTAVDLTNYYNKTQTDNLLLNKVDKTGAVTGVKGSSESTYRTGNVNITKSNIGLGNVENKSSSDIRGEITSTDITNALGYEPLGYEVVEEW